MRNLIYAIVILLFMGFLSFAQADEKKEIDLTVAYWQQFIQRAQYESQLGQLELQKAMTKKQEIEKAEKEKRGKATGEESKP